MKAVASVVLAALVIGASLVAYSSRSQEPTVDMSAVQADLKTVAGARILFAHQSVRRNILEGVQALAAQADVPIRIEETTGKQHVRTLGTRAAELLPLREWLEEHRVTPVAMESTSTCLLVNAAHIKQVPGRETDVQDCVWITQLLEHGLL